MFALNRYKQQYIKTIKLATPAVISNVGQVVVQLVDNAMVGRIGTLPLAAVSFGGTIFFLVFVFSMGLTMGTTPLVGNSFSRRNHKESARYLQNGLLLFVICGVFISLLQLVTIPLIDHMGQPQEVVDMAVPYYRYLVFSLLPFMIFSTCKQFLEGIGNTKIAMIVMLSTNMLNVVGNYLLIYGNWGFPEMGAAGAGLSTMIARFCMPVLILGYMLNNTKLKRYFKFFSINKFGSRYIKSLLKVGTPISLQLLMECSVFGLIAIMMGWIGTTEIAANQIATLIGSLAFMMVLGVCAATTIRVSHEYGVGNLKLMNRSAIASFHIGFAWNIISATAIILLRDYIPMIFTSDPATIELASNLLIFIGIFQISDGIQCVAIGVLRGIKDVKSIMIVASISYLLIGVPTSYICAFVLGFGAPGLWIGTIIGLSVAAILLVSRYRRVYMQIRRARIIKL